MAENKTKATKLSVKKYLDAIKDEQVRKDCIAITTLMKSIMKVEPVMWGTAIVGFGSYHYKYESGREGDMCMIGFSARKNNISIYMLGGFHKVPELMEKLGKHKTGKGCLYINSMEDIDPKILKKLMVVSIKELKKYMAVWKKRAGK
ncbi:hypothetical protein BH09BAC5_BH09BAC5_05470 [soil metagenome]